MGYGRWREEDFRNYSAGRGRTVRMDGTLDTSGHTAQTMYTERGLHPALNPRGVMRECCENEEHPNTMPVILALDVTGSMGSAAMEVAAKLNEVMTELLGTDMDVEFMIMGIGDLAYDRAPIQISQFESDIRIAEQLDKIYFEGGGGGNMFESYTAAWYMALHHTRLDCWKRGQKGLIITMGDEPMNPYLPARPLAQAVGDPLQGDVETGKLLKEIRGKYDLYHIFVRHGSNFYETRAAKSWRKYLDKKHFQCCDVKGIGQMLTGIITAEAEKRQAADPAKGLIRFAETEEVKGTTAEAKETAPAPEDTAAAGIGWDIKPEKTEETAAWTDGKNRRDRKGHGGLRGLFAGGINW